MWVLILGAAFCGLSYVFIIYRYLYYWRRLPDTVPTDDYSPSVFFSVLVPARNESESIVACLEALLHQNYPRALYEIIVLDDHSTDNTVELVDRLESEQIRMFRMSEVPTADPVNAFKKKAIEFGISQARGAVIVTTDADCIVPPGWLRFFSWHFEYHHSVFVAGPVGFQHERNTLERFQSLDYLGMMIITGAGIRGGFMHMCNGASMAYTRAAFDAVDGFKGIDHIASGDDMLLLQKIANRYPERISFIRHKEALVLTTAKPDWPSFLQQRVRWATKSTDYQEKVVTAILAVVFLLCILIVGSLLLISFIGWWGGALFAVLIGLKGIADFWLLSTATTFFSRRDLLKTFVQSQLIHIFYIIVIGFMANLRKEYEWKGRRVR